MSFNILASLLMTIDGTNANYLEQLGTNRHLQVSAYFPNIGPVPLYYCGSNILNMRGKNAKMSCQFINVFEFLTVS